MYKYTNATYPTGTNQLNFKKPPCKISNIPSMTDQHTVKTIRKNNTTPMNFLIFILTSHLPFLHILTAHSVPSRTFSANILIQDKLL